MNSRTAIAHHLTGFIRMSTGVTFFD